MARHIYDMRLSVIAHLPPWRTTVGERSVRYTTVKNVSDTSSTHRRCSQHARDSIADDLGDQSPMLAYVPELFGNIGEHRRLITQSIGDAMAIIR